MIQTNTTISYTDQMALPECSSLPCPPRRGEPRRVLLYSAPPPCPLPASGLRLMRMVRYILDTDEPKTWLDYREHEPNWIQFKFSAEEFDVEKLDGLSRANNGIITEQILRDCIKRQPIPIAE